MANVAAGIWRKTQWAVKSAFDAVFYPRMCAEKRSLDRFRNLADLLPRLCTPRGRGAILANQNVAEIAALCQRVQRQRPKVIVEIGTAKGGTLYLWSRLVEPGGLVVSIDKPGAAGSVRPLSLAVYRSFGRERGVRVHTLAVDSHSAQAHHTLKGVLGNRPVDFLFIDGDHSYDGVKADFFAYQQYLAHDGLIALHDVGIPDHHPTIQVRRFWNELEPAKFVLEKFHAQPGRSPGIGVVRWKPRQLANSA